MSETLSETLNAYDHEHWFGTRSRKSAFCQATLALRSLGVSYASEATPELCRATVQSWRAEGLSARTINERVSILQHLGIPGIARVRRVKPRQWYLRPEDREELDRWLPAGAILRDFISWTCLTGLRVEESLRVRRRDFSDLFGTRPSLAVPGTKTRRSGNTTQPIARSAAIVACSRFTPDTPYAAFLFPVSYAQLRAEWDRARAHIGAEDIPTATLRALRRSAARYLHITLGMPLDVVRDYLRHEDIATTQGYLRLTGGYQEEEVRTWLDHELSSGVGLDVG